MSVFHFKSVSIHGSSSDFIFFHHCLNPPSKFSYSSSICSILTFIISFFPFSVMFVSKFQISFLYFSFKADTPAILNTKCRVISQMFYWVHYFIFSKPPLPPRKPSNKSKNQLNLPNLTTSKHHSITTSRHHNATTSQPII